MIDKAAGLLFKAPIRPAGPTVLRCFHPRDEMPDQPLFMSMKRGQSLVASAANFLFTETSSKTVKNVTWPKTTKRPVQNTSLTYTRYST
jgi:hypothetical protein